MPKYVCNECGDVFESKDALDEHGHDADKSLLPSIDFSVPDLTLKQMAVLGGVFLMATLFMGTVFYASSLGPSSPGQGGGTGARETSPPVGYTIRSQADIPRVSNAQLPQNAVSRTPLGQDVQLYLLTRPAVLLQYSCTGCQETVDALSTIAQQYNGEQTWVYVAPYRDMDERVAVTGFQQGPLRMEAVNRSKIDPFICNVLRDRPVQCAFQ